MTDEIGSSATNGTEAEIELVDDPVLEFYRGRDAVLTVIAVAEEDRTSTDEDVVELLLLDATLGSTDDITVTEYDDLDVLLETNADKIAEVVAAAPTSPDGAAAEEAWEQAVVAVSPAVEPVIVVRNGWGNLSVLDPVEVNEDGTPTLLGTYDSIGDAIWRALEFLAGEDEEPGDAGADDDPAPTL
jgi:hypothetical protein